MKLPRVRKPRAAAAPAAPPAYIASAAPLTSPGDAYRWGGRGRLPSLDPRRNSPWQQAIDALVDAADAAGVRVHPATRQRAVLGTADPNLHAGWDPVEQERGWRRLT